MHILSVFAFQQGSHHSDMHCAYPVPCSFLQKTDLVPKKERTRLERLLKRLNPRAVVVQTVRGVVDLSQIVNTHRFDMEAAQQGAGWLAV